MNSLIENGYISEMECGSNFSFVLNDNSSFLSTEYKVLQSQTDSCFVKCMKMLYNGKIQLYYMTKSYKSFAAILSSLDADSFLTIVSNLFADIIDVKHNGFLSCQNIDISFERIYVDPATYKVSLVYLPLGQRIYDDNASFENEIRTGLIKLISGLPALSSDRTIQLAADLSNGTLSMEDLYSRIKGGKNIMPMVQTVTNEVKASAGGFRIIAMNAPTRVEIEITKDDFVVGKKPGVADGVVSFNDKISRSHCKFGRYGDKYIITDLQSANGTYINGTRIQPNQPYYIKNGDVVRMANSDFQVSIN